MTTVLTGPTVDDRLDRLCAQVEQIAVEVGSQAAARQRWAELAQTLMPLSQGAFGLASRELEQLSADVTVEDAVRFARTMARSLPQLEILLAQITHPEVVDVFDRALGTLREGQSAHLGALTTLGLIRALRDPQTRRGMARVLALLQTLGAEPPAGEATPATRKG